MMYLDFKKNFDKVCASMKPDTYYELTPEALAEINQVRIENNLLPYDNCYFVTIERSLLMFKNNKTLAVLKANTSLDEILLRNVIPFSMLDAFLDGKIRNQLFGWRYHWRELKGKISKSFA